MHNRSLGARGEDLASLYLEKKGYMILERNWRSKGGEIDIVAKDGDVCVFVEVKCRSTHAFGYPEEAITETKKQHLARAAEWYCSHMRYQGMRRVDAIAVTIDDDSRNPQILHIEDILS